MIPVDLSAAIAAYLSISVVLVIGYWIFYNCNSGEGLTIESEHLCECPFCAYVFFDYTKDALKICPRCESYIETVNATKDSQ